MFRIHSHGKARSGSSLPSARLAHDEFVPSPTLLSQLTLNLFLPSIELLQKHNYTLFNPMFLSPLLNMKYSPLEDKSDQDSQPCEDNEALLSNTAPSNRETLPRKIMLISVILIPIASLCLIGLGAWIGRRWLANPNDICPSHVQHYCKLLPLLELQSKVWCQLCF